MTWHIPITVISVKSWGGKLHKSKNFLFLAVLVACIHPHAGKADVQAPGGNTIAERTSTKGWLEDTFPSPNNCTPRNLYFDRAAGESAGKVMESKGYTPYSVGTQIAKYKIKERFFGLAAIEMSIPSDTDSIYTVTVNSSATALLKSIKDKTGIELKIYREGTQVRSGIAYIVPDNAITSTFVCFTFEE